MRACAPVSAVERLIRAGRRGGGGDGSRRAPGVHDVPVKGLTNQMIKIFWNR
jgi:hypothetical protein